ncbi:AcrR family transcriptional regulator [Aequitasia blattaphilus]|uniref:TetR/AcrR family transcriptional regulator n=1 Tax=Aequitasia blattaphilus TaxID=2949332 RepID=A0ABT1E543_9FIRM|nr:TetR/AcrR family transcriptional regulator [Aequitasia blattaphilus]MCP1100950.1 TetR/AcrR family transcriptional regulator [Aequitasia blattaphilus]MCR8613590.1 TetR/AcrR family transcriptional regulator [Aequitasia blattaphilus]
MSENKLSVKNRIIQSAWELFRKKGYEETTVEDIIINSDTSKGSFYYHFSGKDSLLDTLADMLDKKYYELEEKMDPKMNSFDKLLFLNYEMHRYMEDKISLDLLASLYSSQLSSKGEKKLLDRNRKYYRLISSIIEEGQSRNQIVRDKTIHQITQYYAICERALVSDWCMNKGSYSLAAYSRETMPIMMTYYKI